MGYQYKREPLSQEDIGRLTNACEETEEKLAIFTMLDLGLRVAEMADVNVKAVDFQTHRLTVMGKGGASGPRSKRRVLKLSPRLQSLLEPYLRAHESIGMTSRTIQRLVHRVANRAGLTRSISPHVLRHTFAVQALQRGVSLATLMHWLGHNNLQTTAIYLNLAPEDAIKDMESKWSTV